MFHIYRIVFLILVCCFFSFCFTNPRQKLAEEHVKEFVLRTVDKECYEPRKFSKLNKIDPEQLMQFRNKLLEMDSAYYPKGYDAGYMRSERRKITDEVNTLVNLCDGYFIQHAYIKRIPVTSNGYTYYGDSAVSDRIFLLHGKTLEVIDDLDPSKFGFKALME